MLKFSIIIPTFNESKVIDKTLPQFRNPKLSYNIQLIVSDGASTDGTIELANQYADIVAVKTGLGSETIATGRNRGANQANGDIIIFFDADVIVSDLSALLASIEKTFDDPEVVAATTKVRIYPAEEKFFDWIFHTIFWWFIVLLNITGRGAARGECQIIRRSVFKRVNGYNDRLGASEDFELYQRLAKIGKIASLKVLVYESPRRYRKLGYPRLMKAWFLNFLSAMQGKPVGKWPTVR